MKFKIEFKCDNAAFCDSDGVWTGDTVGREVVEVLRRIIGRVEQRGGIVPSESGKALDSNGNTVGAWSLTMTK